MCSTKTASVLWYKTVPQCLGIYISSEIHIYRFHKWQHLGDYCEIGVKYMAPMLKSQHCGLSNGLMPLGNKPSPQAMVTHIYDTICRHLPTMSQFAIWCIFRYASITHVANHTYEHRPITDRPRVWCNIGNPSETCIKFKSREISFAFNIFLIVKSCHYHDMFNFTNNLRKEIDFMDNEYIASEIQV